MCNRLGKSPSAVALEIGLSKTAVHKWKNGGFPTDATASKIASYFNVSITYLLGLEEAEQEEKKNDTITDIIIKLREDGELLDIVESLTKLDADKRTAVKSFLGAFITK